MSLERDAQEAAVLCLRELYRGYGYGPFKMSKFEEYDLYVQNKSFLVSDNVITFTDGSGKLMALKPDVTLSIVKGMDDAPGVRKVYYHENVYRPARGNRDFREIMQVGLECLGDIDDYCIGEVLTLAAESLSEISPDYVLDVSHLGILSEVLARMGVPEESRGALMGYVGEKNLHDATALCRTLGLDPTPLCALLDAADLAARLPSLYDDAAWRAEVERFLRLVSVLPADRVSIDFSVTNDVDYYNGTVFRGFVRGIPNSILSGGQYDRLMRRMGKRGGAVGFAVYLDQLDLLATGKPDVDVDAVYLYDDDTPWEDVQKEVRALVAAGRRVSALRALPQNLRYAEVIDRRGGV